VEAAVPFQRIATRRKSAQVAEQITEAIRRAAYRVGDRLPPERVIADEMGVSRPSVREALSALQIVGVLESRPGDGTYVVRTPEPPDAAISLLETEDSPVETLDARRILERGIAQAVAARPPAGGLAALAEALEAMRRAAAERDFDAFAEANGPFHVALLRATGNPVLERAVRPLIDVMGRRLAQELRRREYLLDGAFFDAVYASHREIYDALHAGDAAGAAEAMDRHFDLIEASLRA
jgi:GntR family transcriptional repressor for pyruvate dehydrogenase complex